MKIPQIIIDAAIIQDKRLLLVKKRASWILPGGRIKPRESALDCLAREVREELSGTKLKNFRFYGNFEGLSPHGNKKLAMVYFADIKGRLYSPSQEILDSRWINDQDIDTGQYLVSDITSKVFISLKRDGYL
jgi:8-oxo-dGTP pyrophosphatase MutT (NUDIX family)